MRLKTGDTVRVMTGVDKGKEGEILKVDKKNDRVIVEGVNVAKKHVKPSQMNAEGGIVESEASIHVSNVMYVHNGEATRLGVKVEEEMRDGKSKKVRKRVAKTTGELID